MLSRRALYAYAVRDEAVYLGIAGHHTLVFEIFYNKAVRSLIGERTERSRTKDVFGAEQLLRVFMHSDPEPRPRS